MIKAKMTMAGGCSHSKNEMPRCRRSQASRWSELPAGKYLRATETRLVVGWAREASIANPPSAVRVDQNRSSDGADRNDTAFGESLGESGLPVALQDRQACP